MPLSRLENFLRSIRGNIIYVDPNALDSTDTIENDGTSAARPFKTLQRALIEAARFSYLPGPDNDKFANTTILLYPGEHLIDNRPGWIPLTSNSFLRRNGTTSTDFNEFDLSTNFDITSDNNALYKLNSVNGGVIIPRGTSIVGYDLRKTKIRPKYVPNPENDNIERSAIFRLTGACYIWQMSIFDADPNGQCFKDYSDNKFVPNFSHHKLTAFEYADGKNNIEIEDAFNSYYTNRTDLDVYYQKIGLAYGNLSGRRITPDYPNTVDIQPKIDEYRIVGSRGSSGISSIFAGDSVTSTTEITVTLQNELEGLGVDTPIRINGVSAEGYNGQYIISEVLSSNKIKYNVPVEPTVAKSGSDGTLDIVIDTVTSASPYIFNCSLRSVYGLCGLHANGNLVTGFKSIVVAQFTGISLQKDNNAFVKYDETTGSYVDKTDVVNIYSDSLAKYKPSYESYHIKASNNSFIQAVSVFAIGYAYHFLGESGGDMSITNSNSNFGAKSLVTKGFRDEKFIRDDFGYISHIIPPKEIEKENQAVEFNSLDIIKTLTVGNSSRLYLYNETNESSPPVSIIDGYRIGSKQNELLYLQIISNGTLSEYTSKIVMPVKGGGNSSITYQKEYKVAKESNGITNRISGYTITLTESHEFINGESVRIYSDTGEVPNGLSLEKIYYVITDDSKTSLANNEIRLATTLNDAENGFLDSSAINIYNTTIANLKIVSRVSDKNSGDIGHPIQYDNINDNWYISAERANNIYSIFPTSGLNVSPRTYILRNSDNRNLEDTIYKFRYVIPKGTSIKARPPIDAYIIQNSTSVPANSSEIEKQYSYDGSTQTLDTTEQLRHTTFISNATWSSSVATIETEIPHFLSVGSRVEVINVLSSNNPTGISTSGFNGTYTITDIPSRREFSYTLSNNPGTFVDNTSSRNTSLPYFLQKKLPGTYLAYRNEQVQEYIQDIQDGIYYISLINSSNSPKVSPFEDLRFSQPVQNLYPQIDRDNVLSDPNPTNSFAVSDVIGKVVVNDTQKSITRETLEEFLFDTSPGFKLNNIITNFSGETQTLYTETDHGLNPITSLTISNAGTAYGSNIGNETLYNANLTGGSGEGASALIRINSSGQIQSFELMNGGSAYQVGDVLTVTGVATTTGHTPGTLTVSSIYNHTDECIRITGISNEDYQNYNNLYRITSVPSSTTINVSSSEIISPASTSGLGNNLTSNANAYLTGKVLTSSLFTYNNTTGFAEVTFSSAHGLNVNDKVKVSGANSSLFNGDFIVSEISSITKVKLNIGKSNTSPATSGTIRVYSYGFTSKSGNNNSGKNENRLITQYNNITTVSSSSIGSLDESIFITNANIFGLKIGDYLQIDDEIVRIKSTPLSSTEISVFRGVLGTRSVSHPSGSVIKKIHVFPIELRRHSILRASGHTFEYVGYGPGNYSNAFPDRQDRQITEQEELLSQSFKVDGGISVYTGMNNDGDFYIGNKKVSSTTGQEDVFDAPIPSVRGEEVLLESGSIINVTSTDNLNVTRSLRVEGGLNGVNLSEFYGPVVFNDKITSNSDRGIECNSIYLQGDSTISRKYTIGESTPTISGSIGDVEYYTQPSDGGYLGWVYTESNAWRKFGPIQSSDGRYVGIWSGTFYGDGSNLTNLDSIWIKTGSTAYYLDEVAIGTNSVDANTKLKVNGNTYINGVLNVTEIIEKATIVSSDWPLLDGAGNAIDINIYLGDNNVYYYTSTVDKNWTLNFTGYSNGTTLNDLLNIGDSITIAFLATNGNTAYYNDSIKIDGTEITPKWYGGFGPTSGNQNSIDSYTYVIIKTANNTFTVLASQSTYA